MAGDPPTFQEIPEHTVEGKKDCAIDFLWVFVNISDVFKNIEIFNILKFP